MEICDLNAYIRSGYGKGEATRLRKAGFIPAVFYGPTLKTMQLSVKAVDMVKILKRKEENIFIKLLIDDGKNIERLSVIKELQRDAVKGGFLHADFYEVSMDHKLVFEVPIHFAGKPRGVESGGELLHLKRELKISCLPRMLPEYVELDVSALDIGHSLKVEDIKVGDGVTILDHGDVAVASVAPPRIAREVEETEVSARGAPEEEAKEVD
jgi:large subunit ribosomal protein L25